jgi:hypothetical protein
MRAALRGEADEFLRPAAGSIQGRTGGNSRWLIRVFIGIKRSSVSRSAGTQIKGNARLTSFEEIAASDEDLAFH